MLRVFFDFNDAEQKYTYEEAGVEYYIPFKLMIRLKGYLREAEPGVATMDVIKKWHSELSLSDKREVVIKNKFEKKAL